jgi:hypothetical protein
MELNQLIPNNNIDNLSLQGIDATEIMNVANNLQEQISGIDGISIKQKELFSDMFSLISQELGKLDKGNGMDSPNFFQSIFQIANNVAGKMQGKFDVLHDDNVNNDNVNNENNINNENNENNNMTVEVEEVRNQDNGIEFNGQEINIQI